MYIKRIYIYIPALLIGQPTRDSHMAIQTIDLKYTNSYVYVQT